MIGRARRPGAVPGRARTAFAVVPPGTVLPGDLEYAGRLDRFDLAVPLASRLGVDVLVLSERLVAAVEGWDAVRALGRLGDPAPEVWVLADGGPDGRQQWSGLATKVIGNPDQPADLRGEPRPTPGREADREQLVVVLGSKGGVGKTFVSANLAAGLSLRGVGAAALDLDFEAGDLALRLGITPQMDLMAISAQGTDSPLQWASNAPAFDLLVWAAPARPELAAVISEESMARLLTSIQTHAAHLVVDTPGDPDCAVTYVALERSTQVILVSTLGPGAVRQARVMVELLKRLNYPVRDRLKLVLNRVRRKSPLTVRDACEVIGLQPSLVLPECPHLAESEAYLGRPTVVAAPRLRVSRLLASLAEGGYSGYRRGPIARKRRTWPLALPWTRSRRDGAQVPRWS